ncbi:hypothetical protein ACQQ2N_07115 [Dokdonella sp. MW10]|uniref:hypothetical protein n=1 Tax=Dokdonella sp. MW10 TaxID=2992926 RepID=UPI003F809FFE
MRAWAMGLAATVGLSGCNFFDTATQGFEHARDVAADIGQHVGHEPYVGFRWSNGSLTSVTINFDDIPAGLAIDELAEVSRRSVAKRFKQVPDNVVIAFSLPGNERGR